MKKQTEKIDIPGRLIRDPLQRYRVQKRQTKPSRTQQSMRDESDVNTIVQRYQRTGVLPPNARGIEPQYVNCVPLQEEFTEALNRSHITIEEYNALVEEAEKQKAEADKKAAETPPPPSPNAPQSQPTGEKGASPQPSGEG